MTSVVFDVLDSNGDLGLDASEVEYALRAMNDGNPLFREANASQLLGDFDRCRGSCAVFAVLSLPVASGP